MYRLSFSFTIKDIFSTLFTIEPITINIYCAHIPYSYPTHVFEMFVFLIISLYHISLKHYYKINCKLHVSEALQILSCEQ